MKRVGMFLVDEILDVIPFIDKSALEQQLGTGQWTMGMGLKVIYFNGYRVKLYSARYQLFKQKGITCVKCGIQGSVFILETNENNLFLANKEQRQPTYHFNLYAYAQDGSEILMTRDHILPVSKGGKNTLENLQVMCEKCNNRKAHSTQDMKPNSCCEYFGIHMAGIMEQMDLNTHYPPFIYCPWCSKKIEYPPITAKSDSV